MEGEIMRNCVATHFHAVLSGREYIYNFTSPVRATLSICKAKNGTWKLSDMNGFANMNILPW